MQNFNHTAADRFLKYVTIDTQSDPTSSTFPSTEKQKNLGKLLVEELRTIGLKDAHLDEFGYVYATLEATVNKDVPVICFCSHMDTSSDCSGKNVTPIVHENYDGQAITLPEDSSVVISPTKHPQLKNQIGNDVITASGTTLLGADNKAGLAAIVDAVAHMKANPQIPHGTIKILFTPDEEIGKGVEHVDLKKLGAKYAYTIDGSTVGSMEDETFSADGAAVTIEGVSAHPGFAKGLLVNAIKIAGEIIDELPKETLSPETTAGREGFIHPTNIEGIAETAVIKFIVRDFETAKLAEHEAVLKGIVDKVMKSHPEATATLTIQEQYRNMKEILDLNPIIALNAEKAIIRAGLELKKSPIRGGTDGSRLSFMGLPCPNIFTGGHGFHSKEEWVSKQDMEKAAEVIVHLASIWSEEKPTP